MVVLADIDHYHPDHLVGVKEEEKSVRSMTSTSYDNDIHILNLSGLNDYLGSSLSCIVRGEPYAKKTG